MAAVLTLFPPRSVPATSLQEPFSPPSGPPLVYLGWEPNHPFFGNVYGKGYS